jgi:hypothetical protein
MIVSSLNNISGFFSMLFFNMNHYIYCKKNNINFILNTDNWLFKYINGWEDYFININITHNNDYIDVINMNCNQLIDNYSIIEYKNIIHEFYKYNNNTIENINIKKNYLNLHDINYDAIFIRRGDKLISESIYISAEKYLLILLQKNQNCRKIFLQTDDYNCFLELENYINVNNLNIELLTLCDKNSKGFIIFNSSIDIIKNDNIKNELNNNYLKINNDITINKSVDKMDNIDIYNHTISMICGIDIVLNSNICITDYSSNVSRFIKLAHKNSNNVYDIFSPNTDIDYNKLMCPSYSF